MQPLTFRGDYLLLYKQHLPQSLLRSKTALKTMNDWRKLKPEPSMKKPYEPSGCDTCPYRRQGGQTCYPLRRRDLAKVSNHTASTMITPMMICWM